MATTDTSTKLTDAEIVRAVQVISAVPVIGLPKQGMFVEAKTVDNLIHIIEKMGEALGDSLRSDQAKTDQLGDLHRDLQAAGRVIIGKMGVALGDQAKTDQHRDLQAAGRVFKLITAEDDE